MRTILIIMTLVQSSCVYREYKQELQIEHKRNLEEEEIKYYRDTTLFEPMIFDKQ